jgi:metacaspase-1
MAKRALCVGINDYPGTQNDLSGCVNDAKDWQAVLTKLGYSVTTLLDSQATRAGMVAGLNTLIQGASDGDDLVFTYSGHGSWLPDENGDEPDGRDEMLCPHDIDAQQFLMDDDLNQIFSAKPPKARLFFISDSCHSGSVSRLGPPIGDAPKVRARLLPPEAFVKDPDLLERVRSVAPATRPARQKYPALLFSGCKDVEVSYDATFAGRPNGALTRVAIDSLASGPKTARQWHSLIRKKLPSADYPQTPQLFGSRTAMNAPLF